VLNNVVHYALYDSSHRAIRVLCGKWRTGASWTVEEPAVTCPECLRLLGEQKRLVKSRT
jgi:hypothetical protein